MTGDERAPASFAASVIIPARDAASTLCEQLDALAAQEFSSEWEVIVADNGSLDKTVALALSYQDRLPNLRIVDASSGPGAGHARNEGAREAQGALLLFCDADDVVVDGWLQALVEGLDCFDAVGGAVDEESLNSPETRAARHPLAAVDLPLAFGFPRAPSGNLGVRRTVFEALGGFDETYLVSEDTEFSIRLQASGYRLGYVPDALVQYRHGDGLIRTLRKVYRWNVIRPRLYAEYRVAGATRSVLWGLSKWPWLVLCSYYLVAGRERRWQWLARAVASTGRLVGSIRYGAFVP